MRVYIPLRPLCQFMALSWPSQRNRIYRDDVLKPCVFIKNTQLPGDTQRREHVCLPLDMLPGWLFGISTTRVKPDLQEKIKRYRRECFRVLWEAFKPHILREESALAATDGDPAIQELQRIAEMGRAIMQMAEQRIELQRQQQALVQRLDKAGRVVRGMQLDLADIQVRLGSVEDKLHPHASITAEQASHIAQLGNVRGLLGSDGGVRVQLVFDAAQPHLNIGKVELHATHHTPGLVEPLHEGLLLAL